MDADSDSHEHVLDALDHDAVGPAKTKITMEYLLKKKKEKKKERERRSDDETR